VSATRYTAFSYTGGGGNFDTGQKTVGRFNNRAEADRAAYLAVTSDPGLQSASVVGDRGVVYYIDRAEIANGACRPRLTGDPSR
jgi:hypothetical protein